jgi:hypothetical protein
VWLLSAGRTASIVILFIAIITLLAVQYNTITTDRQTCSIVSISILFEFAGVAVRSVGIGAYLTFCIGTG